MYEEWGSELVNTPDSTHNTPLHIAAKKGHINSLKVMRQKRERERWSEICIYITEEGREREIDGLI